MDKRLQAHSLKLILGAAIFQAALVGFLINSVSTLLAQIRLDYGFSVTRISMFSILRSASSALGGTLVTSLLFRMDGARVLVGTLGLELLGFVLLIFGADTWLWYIAPVLLGPASTVSSIAVPYYLILRVPNRAGFVTGIVMAFSGIGGALANPLEAWLIRRFGWQVALGILCVLTLILGSLGLFLMFHGISHSISPPSAEKKAVGQVGRQSFRLNLRFVLCCLTLLSGTVSVSFVPYASLFAQSVGYSLTVGATLTSAIMAGNIVGKLCLGFLCDIWGTWRSMGICLSCLLAGILGFALFFVDLPLMYPAALMFGFCYGIAAVGVSRCCLAAYAPWDMQRYSGLHSSINSVAGAGASLLIGTVVDITGSFSTVLYVMALVTTGSLLATFLLKRLT